MRKQTLQVKAVAHPVPKIRTRVRTDRDGKDLTMIHVEDGVVEVPNDLYYRKRIAAGDLAEVESRAKPVRHEVDELLDGPGEGHKLFDHGGDI